MRRVTTGLGIETAPHRALDHWVSLLMVAAGLGTTVLPALALEGQVPEGISIYSFPGLGARRIVARHRATRGEPSDATRAVINAMIDVSLDLAEHFEDVTE